MATATRLLVLLTLLLWGVWDVVAVRAGGGPATISAAFGDAFGLRWAGWWAIGTFGFVCGHLLGMTPPGAELCGWRVGLAVAAAVAGFVLTVRS